MESGPVAQNPRRLSRRARHASAATDLIAPIGQFFPEHTGAVRKYLRQFCSGPGSEGNEAGTVIVLMNAFRKRSREMENARAMNRRISNKELRTAK